jgi:hypothetical protein
MFVVRDKKPYSLTDVGVAVALPPPRRQEAEKEMEGSKTGTP